MRYIDAIEGAVIALIVFSIIFLAFPTRGGFDGAEVVLTVSTFLFAILTGFYLSRLNTRFNALRDLVVQEDSLFRSFFQTSRLYGDVFTKKIVELMDKYYIVSYDFLISEYDNQRNEHYFQAMWDEVIALKKYRSESGHQQLVSLLQGIQNCRTQATSNAFERLSFGEWVSLLTLATIILFSIFGLKTDAFYFQIITILLSSTLVLVLLIIRDLENLRIGGQGIWAEESGQQVFALIGKPRYHHYSYLLNRLNEVPKHVSVYRVGTHEPGADKHQIKTVRR